MAESNSLLNCRRSNLTAGSNPALSAIFFAKMRDSLNENEGNPRKAFLKSKKNGEGRRTCHGVARRAKTEGFTLLRVAQLHLKPQVFFLATA